MNADSPSAEVALRQQGRNSKDLVNAQKTGDRKAGVVWHTQGSGKSLSMVFYTGKIVLALDNPTVVVITDRNDLDDQLFGTFSSATQLLRQTPKQADNREELKEYLRVASGGVVFTTIQNSSLMMAAISMSCCQTEPILSLSLMKPTVHNTVSAPKKLT